jgi:hypothetical protein
MCALLSIKFISPAFLNLSRCDLSFTPCDCVSSLQSLIARAFLIPSPAMRGRVREGATREGSWINSAERTARRVRCR